MEEETTFEEQGHSFASPLGKNSFSCNQAQDRRSATAISQKKDTIRNNMAAKTTFMIVFGFAFCWLPFTLLSMTLSACKDCYVKIPNQLFDIFLMMGYFNSTINPVLYSFRTPRFKKAFKGMIRNKCKICKNGKGNRCLPRSDNSSLAVLSFTNLGVTLREIRRLTWELNWVENAELTFSQYRKKLWFPGDCTHALFRKQLRKFRGNF